jgi:hypothetical protein
LDLGWDQLVRGRDQPGDVAGVVPVRGAVRDRAVLVLDDVFDLGFLREASAFGDGLVFGLEAVVAGTLALNLIGPLAVE